MKQKDLKNLARSLAFFAEACYNETIKNYNKKCRYSTCERSSHDPRRDQAVFARRQFAARIARHPRHGVPCAQDARTAGSGAQRGDHPKDRRGDAGARKRGRLRAGRHFRPRIAVRTRVQQVGRCAAADGPDIRRKEQRRGVDGARGACRGDVSPGGEGAEDLVSALLRGQDADGDLRRGGHLAGAGLAAGKECHRRPAQQHHRRPVTPPQNRRGILRRITADL